MDELDADPWAEELTEEMIDELLPSGAGEDSENEDLAHKLERWVDEMVAEHPLTDTMIIELAKLQVLRDIRDVLRSRE